MKYCTKCGDKLIANYVQTGTYSHTTGEKLYYGIYTCPSYKSSLWTGGNGHYKTEGDYSYIVSESEINSN